MTPAEFSTRILAPAAAAFPFHDDPRARALLLAIAGVESGWAMRAQSFDGPAAGWWQFEVGGIVGVMEHPASRDVLREFCDQQAVPFERMDIHTAIEWHDGLAYALARLLLWTDPAPLPTVGDEAGGWLVYNRLWKPGKPSAPRWTTRYAEALAVTGAAVAGRLSAPSDRA